MVFTPITIALLSVLSLTTLVSGLVARGALRKVKQIEAEMNGRVLQIRSDLQDLRPYTILDRHLNAQLTAIEVRAAEFQAGGTCNPLSSTGLLTADMAGHDLDLQMLLLRVADLETLVETIGMKGRVEKLRRESEELEPLVKSLRADSRRLTKEVEDLEARVLAEGKETADKIKADALADAAKVAADAEKKARKVVEDAEKKAGGILGDAAYPAAREALISRYRVFSGKDQEKIISAYFRFVGYGHACAALSLGPLKTSHWIWMTDMLKVILDSDPAVFEEDVSIMRAWGSDILARERLPGYLPLSARRIVDY